MTVYTPNPPWVDRVVNDNWDRIVRRAPVVDGSKAIPQIVKKGRTGKRSFQEFGCGHFGCVMATRSTRRRVTDQRVVFKVTSDASEAAFVSAALSLHGKDAWPEGIVRYYGIYEVDAQHRGRRVFVLWREEARDVEFLKLGKLSREQPEWKQRDWRESHGLLVDFLLQADRVRIYLKRARDVESALLAMEAARPFADRYLSHDRAMSLTGASLAAVGLRHCEQIAEMMEHANPTITSIGAALSEYLEAGLLLADVHGSNVGFVDRPPDKYYDARRGRWIALVDKEHEVAVITDPGHMVPLRSEWLDVQVPKL